MVLVLSCNCSWQWLHLWRNESVSTSRSTFTPVLTSETDLLPRNGARNGTIDIRSPEFFWVSGYWFRKDPKRQAATSNTSDPISFPAKTPCKSCPHIGSKIDYFAKSMYAFVLADLGQKSDQLRKSNILLQPHLLEHFSANISHLNSRLYPSNRFPGGPANDSYNATAQAAAPPLNITDSFIYAQYLCQIPALKTTGPLFVSIFIADLVLLQALWKLLNWITTAWLERRDPHANVCEGCYHRQSKDVLRRSEENSRNSSNNNIQSNGNGNRGSLVLLTLPTAEDHQWPPTFTSPRTTSISRM